MMPPSEPPYELEVSRADLAQALKIVVRALGKRLADASLSFQDGSLSIEAANTVADATARGTWPHSIFVSASWVRGMAKCLPAGDPIHLRVDAGRLYTNRHSGVCAGTPSKQPEPAERPAINEDLLISKAARILKPLRIKESHLEGLVAEARARGTAWSAEEEKTLGIVVKAWVLLAPLGVEVADIRRLVDSAVRNAWK
jgi:hypothetical protein